MFVLNHPPVRYSVGVFSGPVTGASFIHGSITFSRSTETMWLSVSTLIRCDSWVSFRDIPLLKLT